MQAELMRLKKKDKEQVLEEGFKDVVPEPERVKELEEVIAQLGSGEERF